MLNNYMMLVSEHIFKLYKTAKNVTPLLVLIETNYCLPSFWTVILMQLRSNGCSNLTFRFNLILL